MTDLVSFEFRTESVLLPIKDLIFTVEPFDVTFYSELRFDISGGNLFFPVVAVHCTGRDWNEAMGSQSVLRLAPTDDDQMYYFVTCGNNRGKIAKELGYENISTIVVPTFDDGSPYCKQMRKWYDKRCGRRNRE